MNALIETVQNAIPEILSGITNYWNYKRRFPVARQKRFLKTFSRLLRNLNPGKAIFLMQQQAVGIEAEILSDIDESLQRGGKIYEACEPWFDRMVVTGLRFGEENNQLRDAIEDALINLNLSNSNLFASFQKVIYPLILTFAAMSAITFVGKKMLAIIDYKLKKMITLPMEMKFFKGVINFYENWFTLSLIMLICAMAFAWFYFRTSTSESRLKLDKYFPFSEYRTLNAIGFLRQFSMLKRFNLSDLSALNSIDEMTTSPYMKYHLGQMKLGMQSGNDIGTALDTGLIDGNDVLTLKVLSDAAAGEFVEAIDSTCEGASDAIINRFEVISTVVKYVFMIIGCLLLLDLAVVMLTLDQYMK